MSNGCHVGIRPVFDLITQIGPYYGSVVLESHDAILQRFGGALISASRFEATRSFASHRDHSAFNAISPQSLLSNRDLNLS